MNGSCNVVSLGLLRPRGGCNTRWDRRLPGRIYGRPMRRLDALYSRYEGEVASYALAKPDEARAKHRLRGGTFSDLDRACPCS